MPFLFRLFDWIARIEAHVASLQTAITQFQREFIPSTRLGLAGGGVEIVGFAEFGRLAGSKFGNFGNFNTPPLCVGRVVSQSCEPITFTCQAGASAGRSRKMSLAAACRRISEPSGRGAGGGPGKGRECSMWLHRKVALEERQRLEIFRLLPRLRYTLLMTSPEAYPRTPPPGKWNFPPKCVTKPELRYEGVPSQTE
jgi:hypothetical protein